MKGMIDALYIPILVGIFILIAAVIYEVFYNVSSALGTATGLGFFTNFSAWNSIFSFLIIAVYFGLPIVGMVLSYLSGIHPIFLPFGIVLIIASVFIFGIMQGVILELIPNFSNAYAFISSNTILSKLVQYYPLIMAVFGILIIMLQFLAG
jgi:hypothetical protein